MRTPKTLTTIAVAVVFGLGTGIGLAQAIGDDPPPAWHPAPTDSPIPATPSQKAAYAVLGAEPTDQDGRNGQVATLAEHAGVGFDAAGARVVGSSATGPIWLIPVNGGLCLGLEDTAGQAIGTSCEPSDDVVARGTTIGDGTHIYGIVPDDATAVTITPEGGQTITVPLGSDRVYTVPSSPATLTVTGPGGATEFDVNG